MFHLQQSVEKLIKSLLSHQGIKYPRTHDIEKLIEICYSNHIPLPEYIIKFIDLTDYASEGRYAYILDDMGDCASFLNLIEKFFDYIQIKLNIEQSL